MPLQLVLHCRGDCLTADRMSQLIDATAGRRHELRDRAMLLTMYRHGLRTSELCKLRREDYIEKQGRLHVRRIKGGLSTVQPVEADEAEALDRYLAVRNANIPWLFLSERRTKLSRQGVYYIIRDVARSARLDVEVHPLMLRHACVHYLSEKGYDLETIQLYLGRRRVLPGDKRERIEEANSRTPTVLDDLALPGSRLEPDQRLGKFSTSKTETDSAMTEKGTQEG